MEQISYYTTLSAFVILILGWFIFAATFLARVKPKSAPDAKNAPKSFIGLGLQGIGFALVWGFRRSPLFSSFIGEQYVLNIILQVSAVLIAIASIRLANSAVRELGKQWSLEARLVENHNLITSGVYQIVRHPIYTAMLGMMIATGLIFSNWMVLILAVVIFIIGTKIRTINEEKLLRDAFPKEYEDYAKKVPAFIPFVKI